MEHVELNDGNRIPAIGFGVFMVPDGGPTHEATLAALKAGYRHIDTAAAYMNEGDVGRAVRDSGVPRDQIWVTTKLWPQDYAAADAPAVNQVECNPLFQQRELRDVLDPLDVVLECWYPLGHGSAELLGNPTIFCDSRPRKVWSRCPNPPIPNELQPTSTSSTSSLPTPRWTPCVRSTQGMVRMTPRIPPTKSVCWASAFTSISHAH